ncbi:MAG TPA: hypothetical protein VKE94_11715, partial [Gemmataceae bacterium]|nr:hypothetical protein [Gemmataceae bacterium]
SREPRQRRIGIAGKNRGRVMKTWRLELGVDSPPADDLAELEATIQYRLSGRVSDFHVRLVDRTLVLCGRARTYYAKQLAQHAAMDASGLPVLANEIVVA